MSTKVRIQDNASSFMVLQSSGEYVENDDAVATCTAAWFVYPFETATTKAPTVDSSAHPVYTNLVCSEFSIKKHGTGAIITASYEGVSCTWDSDEDASSNTVEVSCTMREEPIETHPDFTTWAGTPSIPIAGRFDSDGDFLGWDVSTPIGEELKGITSYLVPSYAATKSYKSSSEPSLGATGSIGSFSGLPSLPDGRQWMLTGISYSKISSGSYDVTVNYLSSDTKGWNTRIYSF